MGLTLPSPRRLVARVPVRVADVGGWTDTWFGSPGRVCHLAVGPGVQVEAALVPGSSGGRPVHLSAPDVGIDLLVGPSDDGRWTTPGSGTEPLLEHAVAAVLEDVELPDGLIVELEVSAAVPPGASLGTSAAVVVGIVTVLDRLVAGGRRTPAEIAVLSHDVETRRVGREAGVQDQWAAAFGGVGLLAVGPYPHVKRTEVAVAANVLSELGDRLVTVIFGSHDSSAVHAQVINDLVGCSGPDHERARQALSRLAALAGDAAAALTVGDIGGWADVLTSATEAQAALHPALVGPAHAVAIEMARSSGASGWKVNGAGGAGGSLTVVAASAGAAAELADGFTVHDRSWTVPDLRPVSGTAACT